MDPKKYTSVGELFESKDSKRQEELDLLLKSGIHSLELLVTYSRKRLVDVTGIDPSRAWELLEKAYMTLPPTPFRSASSVLDQRRETIRISSGSSKIDGLIGGGFETGIVSLISGASAVGKTQLGFTLSVTAQLPLEMKGGNGKCIYISTNNSFRPERIQDVAIRFEKDPTTITDGVIFSRVFNTNSLLNALNECSNYFSGERYSMLIVDCVGQMIRSEFSDVIGNDRRNRAMASIYKKLMGLAEQFNIAVVAFNVAYPNFDHPRNRLWSLPFTPYGGTVNETFCVLRSLMYVGDFGERKFRVLASPQYASAGCSFRISSEGICD